MNRVMEQNHRPLLGVVLQCFFQPAGLFGYHPVRVQGNEPHILVIEIIHHVFAANGAVFRQVDLGIPVPGQAGQAQRAGVFVVARGKEVGHGSQNKGTGFKPLLPIVIRLGLVHQVAGMDHKPGLGRGGIGSPQRARP
jgi:hypothetical protein